MPKSDLKEDMQERRRIYYAEINPMLINFKPEKAHSLKQRVELALTVLVPCIKKMSEKSELFVLEIENLKKEITVLIPEIKELNIKKALKDTLFADKKLYRKEHIPRDISEFITLVGNVEKIATLLK